MEEKKLINHWVVIDEYTEIKLNIPERLTTIELQALMVRAKKLFNLSEITVDAPTTKRKYNKLSDNHINFIVDAASKGFNANSIQRQLKEDFNVSPSWEKIKHIIDQHTGNKNAKHK